MRLQQFPAGYKFVHKRVLVRLEGGYISAAEDKGKFYLVTNEGMMAELLDESDQDLPFVSIKEFDSEEERQAYIQEQSWARYIHENP